MRRSRSKAARLARLQAPNVRIRAAKALRFARFGVAQLRAGRPSGALRSLELSRIEMSEAERLARTPEDAMVVLRVRKLLDRLAQRIVDGVR